jgi:hypothetical protein
MSAGKVALKNQGADGAREDAADPRRAAPKGEDGTRTAGGPAGPESADGGETGGGTAPDPVVKTVYCVADGIYREGALAPGLEHAPACIQNACLDVHVSDDFARRLRGGW